MYYNICCHLKSQCKNVNCFHESPSATEGVSLKLALDMYRVLTRSEGILSISDILTLGVIPVITSALMQLQKTPGDVTGWVSGEHPGEDDKISRNTDFYHIKPLYIFIYDLSKK